MKLLSALLTVSWASWAAASGCDADNCARAVTGTAHGLAFQSSARADCSSFFQATVYPAPVTSTVTTTIFPFTAVQTSTSTIIEQTDTLYPLTKTDFSATTTVVDLDTYTTTLVAAATVTDFITTGTTTVQPEKRTVTPVFQPLKRTVTICTTPSGTVQPSSVPTYASACSGVVRYSSACSCWGASATTITVSTPTSYTTTTITGTTTLTTDVAATSVTTLSDTTVITSLIGTTTTESLIDTASVTSTVTSSVLATSTANALCQSGLFVNGLSAPCTDPACADYILRIEGATDTIYEGPIRTGPRDITTPSGGTHLCNGENGGANVVASGTPTTALDSANGLCGFGYDGSWESEFDDYFIQSIGGDAETSTEFWGILINFQFTPVPGCQFEPKPNDEILWAYNAFNAQYFLNVEPRTASLAIGGTQVFTITDGNTGVPLEGASFNGLTSNANGQVTFTATVAGTFRYKATLDGNIRSPVAIITVT